MGNLLPIQIVPTLPDWLPAALVNLGVLLALGIAILLGAVMIRGVLRIRWKTLTQTRQVRIANGGNVPGVFQIQAQSPEKALRFRYRVNGVPLAVVIPPKPNPKPVAAARPNGPAASAVSGGQPAGAAPAAAGGLPVAPPDAATKKQAEEAYKKLKGKGEAGLGVARIGIGIVGTLGGLIPGEWGKALKGKSTEMLAKSQVVDAQMRVPEQQMQLAESLKGQVGNLQKATGLQKPEDALQAAQAAGQAVGQPGGQPVGQVAGPAGAQPAIAPAVETIPEEPVVAEERLVEYVETGVVPPEQTITLELGIDPRDLYKTAEYPIRMLVRQVPQAKTPPLEKVPDTVIDQVIPIQGISLLYKVLTAFLIIVAVAVNLYWVTVFIRWLAGLVA